MMATIFKRAGLLILVIVVSSCTKDAQVQPYLAQGEEAHIGLTKEAASTTLVGEAAFDQYFKYERTIQLSEDYLIGTIRAIDVNAEGTLLVTDGRNNQVVLFNRDGQYIKTLSTEDCHPGFHWSPHRAYFDAEGEIVVHNRSFPAIARFTASGTCIATVRELHSSPNGLTSISGDAYYGFLQNNEGYYVAKLDAQGNEVKRFAQASRYKNFLSRYGNASYLSYGSDGFIYQVMAFSPYVYKFDQEGEYQGFLGWRPPYYVSEEEDLPDAVMVSGEWQQALMARAGRTTQTFGVHLLDENQLLVLYFNPLKGRSVDTPRRGVIVMDFEGRRLVEEELVLDDRAWFECARDGRIYNSVPAVLDANDHLGNPTISVYRFTPSAAF